jgi:hypothetical protein
VKARGRLGIRGRPRIGAGRIAADSNVEGVDEQALRLDPELIREGLEGSAVERAKSDRDPVLWPEDQASLEDGLVATVDRDAAGSRARSDRILASQAHPRSQIELLLAMSVAERFDAHQVAARSERANVYLFRVAHVDRPASLLLVDQLETYQRKSERRLDGIDEGGEERDARSVPRGVLGGSLYGTIGSAPSVLPRATGLREPSISIAPFLRWRSLSRRSLRALGRGRLGGRAERPGLGSRP